MTTSENNDMMTEIMINTIHNDGENGYLEVVKYLVSQGADIRADDDFAVRWASENGYLEVVKYLVSQGADIRAVYDFAVRLACENGYLEVVKYLVSQGADIRAVYNYAVRYASENGNLEVVKYLVSHGADIRAYDDEAVRLASIIGHLEVVKYLVSQGADIHKIYTKHKKIIYAEKIQTFYRNQRDRKKILRIWKEIVPLYYHPEAKGGYFAKKEIASCVY